ncbi:MAG: hypothetical protein HWN81_02915 [Candidatus Lokiarchaeota archaeon]|nr:hypothetical protein [Candidatus Lokiarchaeota archaeon]
MKRTDKIFLIFVITLIINLNFAKFDISVGNPVAIPIYQYSGGLLPQENVSFSLISANVIIDADTSDLRYLGGISFEGNYTVFNPKNDLNLTVAAPFSIYPENNLSVSVNGMSVPSDILYYDELESQLWEDYIDNISWGNLLPRYWILCNISIPKNKTVEIQYEFNNPKPTISNDPVSFDILYDVGTARLWNGTITEKVEIKAHGHTPNSIYNEQLCNVSDVLDGKSHIWEWLDERIEINLVGVHYYYDGQYEYNTFYSTIKIIFISFVTIIGIAVILTTMYFRRKRL